MGNMKKIIPRNMQTKYGTAWVEPDGFGGHAGSQHLTWLPTMTPQDSRASTVSGQQASKQASKQGRKDRSEQAGNQASTNTSKLAH